MDKPNWKLVVSYDVPEIKVIYTTANITKFPYLFYRGDIRDCIVLDDLTKVGSYFNFHASYYTYYNSRLNSSDVSLTIENHFKDNPNTKILFDTKMNCVVANLTTGKKMFGFTSRPTKETDLLINGEGTICRVSPDSGLSVFIYFQQLASEFLYKENEITSTNLMTNLLQTITGMNLKIGLKDKISYFPATEVSLQPKQFRSLNSSFNHKEKEKERERKTLSLKELVEKKASLPDKKSDVQIVLDCDNPLFDTVDFMSCYSNWVYVHTKDQTLQAKRTEFCKLLDTDNLVIVFSQE